MFPTNLSKPTCIINQDIFVSSQVSLLFFMYLKASCPNCQLLKHTAQQWF